MNIEYEMKSENIDIDLNHKEFNLLFNSDNQGNNYTTITFDQVKKMAEEIKAAESKPSWCDCCLPSNCDKCIEPYHQWLKPLEEIYFKQLMRANNNNQSKVAIASGLNRGTTRKKLKQCNLILS